jgi:hypothetical protein
MTGKEVVIAVVGIWKNGYRGSKGAKAVSLFLFMQAQRNPRLYEVWERWVAFCLNEGLL